MEVIFNKAIERCYSLLGENAFEKEPSINGARKRKNTVLFEVWMVSLGKLNETTINKLEKNEGTFKRKSRELLKDTEFFSVITYATQKEDHVRIRYEKVSTLIGEMAHD